MQNTRTAFKEWFKDNYNFMAPNLVKFKIVGDNVVELARSRETRKDTLYGVTVVDFDEDTGYSITSHADNKPFGDKGQAEDYFDYLVGELKRGGDK